MNTSPGIEGRPITKPREGDLVANDIIVSLELAKKIPGMPEQQRLLVLDARNVDITVPPIESVNYQLLVTARRISNSGQVDTSGDPICFYIPMELGREESGKNIPFVKSVIKLGTLRGNSQTTGPD